MGAAAQETGRSQQTRHLQTLRSSTADTADLVAAPGEVVATMNPRPIPWWVWSLFLALIFVLELAWALG